MCTSEQMIYLLYSFYVRYLPIEFFSIYHEKKANTCRFKCHHVLRRPTGDLAEAGDHSIITNNSMAFFGQTLVQL